MIQEKIRLFLKDINSNRGLNLDMVVSIYTFDPVAVGLVRTRPFVCN